MHTTKIKLKNDDKLKIPLAGSRVEAGFPSPADDYLEGTIDFNEYIVRKPSATFNYIASGDSMLYAGILPGSLIVSDRSIKIKNGLICVARIGSDLTVKRFYNRGTHIELAPENPEYKSIIVGYDEDFEIRGVVISVVTKTI